MSSLKERILQATRGGFDYFQNVFAQNGQTLRYGKNVGLKNTLYDDRNGSVAINVDSNGTTLYHDFGNPRYSGDMFNLAAEKYGLDVKRDFKEINKRLAEELNLEIEDENNQVQLDYTIQYGTDLAYWNQFTDSSKISSIATKYRVHNVLSFQRDGKSKIIARSGNPIYSFGYGSHCLKLYQPYGPKAYKHQWLGKKDEHQSLWGVSQLKSFQDIIILTEGPKDCFNTIINGFNAISIDNASSNIPEGLIKTLKEKCNRLVIIFDNDRAGIEGMRRLASKHELEYYIIPKSLSIEKYKNDQWGNDLSDYWRCGVESGQLALFKTHLVNQIEELETEDDTERMNELEIPNDVYRDLPGILKEGCAVFNSEIEKAVFLIGALGIISGSLPNVEGKYARHSITPQLYIFLSAPASAGKGTLEWSKKLAWKIHKKLRADPLRDKSMLFIPANISSSALIETLDENNSSGILYCTEADTLSTALKQDWGNFSDILRKAYHHESSGMLRKTEAYRELDAPHLAVVLSGTPDQLFRLIPSMEDGLFSRFAFFSISLKPKWKDVFENNHFDYDKHFEALGDRLLALHDTLELYRDCAIKFRFTKTQQKHHFNLFTKWHDDFYNNLDKQAIATLRRLGVVHFRIAMLLTILRLEGNELSEITCSDLDFDLATKLTKVFKENAAEVISKMKSSGGKNKHAMNAKSRRLYHKLPSTFKRKDVLDLVQKYGVSSATFDRLLNKKKLFKKIGYGEYQKLIE